MKQIHEEQLAEPTNSLNRNGNKQAENCFKSRKRKAATMSSDKIERVSSRLRPKSFTRESVAKLSLIVVLLCFLGPNPFASLRVKFVACDEPGDLSSAQVKITIQPNDLIAIEGESAELNCDAEGDPEPKIEWYHNGQLIRSSTNTRTTMGGSIQFLDVRPNTTLEADSSPQQQQSDVGVYHCLAKNQFGQARSRNASLQVACKYNSGLKVNSN